MRVASALLVDLGRSVDRDVPGPPEPILDVPPRLLAYVSLPHSIERLTAVSPSEPKRSSFIAERVIIRTNQVTDTQVVCAFGQGLWYVETSLWFVSSHTDFLTELNGAQLRLEDPGGNGLAVAVAEPVTNVPQYLRRCLHLLVEELPGTTQVFWRLMLTVFTTGLGETSHAKVHVAAAKLL